MLKHWFKNVKIQYSSSMFLTVPHSEFIPPRKDSQSRHGSHSERMTSWALLWHLRVFKGGTFGSPSLNVLPHWFG